MSQKHQMVRYEPVIQSNTSSYVHHILMYNCPVANDSDVGTSFECYRHERPKHLDRCYDVIIAWAVGGVAYNFPDNAGFSLGTADDPRYLLMETHYNNPIRNSGLVDSSGITIIATTETRQYDAGCLMTGMNSNKLIVVPPYEKSFTHSGHCSQECLNLGLQNQTSGIRVFSVLQHAHLIGVGIKTRHIRGDTELKPIADDQHYDFDYQDFRSFTREREIISGDRIIVECTYDSQIRSKPTYGGLSTSNEMCLSIMYYYPRINMTNCLSVPLYNTIAPNHKEAIRKLKTWNWTDPKARNKFSDALHNSTMYNSCTGSPFKSHTDVYKLEEPVLSYKKPRNDNCKSN